MVRYVWLKRHGYIVDLYDDPAHEEQRPYMRPMTGRNLFGVPYQKGRVDIVIPTTDIKKAAPIPASKKLGNVTKVERIFTKETGGFATSCNIGAKPYVHTGEYILFLNDDAVMHAGFLEEMVSVISHRQDVGILGNQNSRTEWGVNGSIMLIRRELFELIGGFDERYFFMWEDNDICEAVKRMGYKVDYTDAPCDHKGGRSLDTCSPFWEDNFFAGQSRFLRKWDATKRIVGSMICGEEEGRYLERSVSDLFDRGLIDELVLVLDAPTDGTAQIARQMAQKYKIAIHHHPKKLFGTAENLLRERAIEYAVSRNAWGIVAMDTDEVFDADVTRAKLEDWLERGMAWDFYIAHYWKNQTDVRIDGLFGHQKNVRLFRVMNDRPQTFYGRPVHCGSAPVYAYENRRTSDHLFLHYGYASERDVLAKIKRYNELDPNGVYESGSFYAQFKSEATTIPYDKTEFLKHWHT